MTDPKKACLAALVEELKAAKDVGRVSTALDAVLAHAPHAAEESGESFKAAAAQIGTLFDAHPKSFEVLEKAAKATAELAKLDAGRGACTADEHLIAALTAVLDLNNQPALQLQACRALGNICYENEDGSVKVLGREKGLETVIKLLGQAIKNEKRLKNVVAGLLQNLLAYVEEAQRRALELGVVATLTDFLESDNEEEDGLINVLIVLNNLADVGDDLLDERLCRALVALLGRTASGEVSEMCLEIMQTKAENDTVKCRLAKAGLCEQLNALVQKHKELLQDDEARGLLKMACDLIASVLGCDESMEMLYLDGEGQVFKDMRDWLSSDDEELQVTAVLAMGNFARTDKHCTQIVQRGIGKKLIELVAKNNSVSGAIRLQHALLGALRNLAIPAENKPILLKDGLLASVLPMVEVPTLPVVFKLLATLRMVIKGQESAAIELGKNKNLVEKLVSWCSTEDHPGVQGEANRLLAWIVKNSKSSEVFRIVAEASGLRCLAAMLSAEHALMQNEALVALALVASFAKDLPEEAVVVLCEEATATHLCAILKAAKDEPIAANALAVIKLLVPLAKESLLKANIPDALLNLPKEMTIKDEAQRVANMLKSS